MSLGRSLDDNMERFICLAPQSHWVLLRLARASLRGRRAKLLQASLQVLLEFLGRWLEYMADSI